jgi:hypothetical protein
MSIYSDVQAYIGRIERGTYGAAGGVATTLIGLPVASLVGIAELVRGKSPQEAWADVSARYGSFVDGGERFGREHAEEITHFVTEMMKTINEEQAKRRRLG